MVFERDEVELIFVIVGTDFVTIVTEKVVIRTMMDCSVVGTMTDCSVVGYIVVVVDFGVD